MKKTIASISVESRMLYSRLLKLAVGETVTYEELSTIIGRNVQREARGRLATAVNKLRSDDGIIIATVRSLGVKRCDDSEKVDAASMQLSRSRRAAKKGIKICTAVEKFEEMPKEKQLEHNMLLSQMGVIQHVTDHRTAKKIEKQIENAKTVIPPMKFLEAFAKS